MSRDGEISNNHETLFSSLNGGGEGLSGNPVIAIFSSENPVISPRNSGNPVFEKAPVSREG